MIERIKLLLQSLFKQTESEVTMGHEIENLDNPIYHAKPAWHGAGTVVENAPTSRECLEIAKMDWAVGKEPACTQSGLVVPGYYWTIRADLPEDDVQRVLGLVKERYEVIQNVEAFTLADEIVGQGNARYEAAGSLRNGKVIWLLAKLPDQMKVQDDTIEKFLLVTSAHDGTRAMQILFTPVRVVCMNTLTMALREVTGQVVIRHMGDTKAQIKMAKNVLKQANTYFTGTIDVFERLAQEKLNDRFIQAYLAALIPDPKKANSKSARGRVDKQRESIFDLFIRPRRGDGQEAINGTAYGLYQATTDWLDHTWSDRKSSKPEKEQAERRLDRLVFQGGSKMRQRSFDLLQYGLGLEQAPDGDTEALTLQAVRQN